MTTPRVSRWAQLLRAAGVRAVLEKVPMSAHTAFRIGGPADVMAVPDGVGQLRAILRVCHEYGIPLTVVGRGSNLLVSDQGIEGVVVKIGRGLSEVRFDGRRLWAQAGAPLPAVAWQAAMDEKSGLEFGVMIPGSVGGAVVMNAGAHHGCIGPLVRQVDCLDREGREVALGPQELEFGYRTSALQRRPDLVVVSVTLELAPRSREQIVREMEAHLEVRRRTQPLGEPGAGSIFKNPPGDFAGRLIERAGLKGWRRGDVEVSPLHANFIVNKGQATCAEVLEAIRMVQARVLERFGVLLELEVRLVGRFAEADLVPAVTAGPKRSP